MLFGQVVIGPPGSGKTTYCAAAAELLNSKIGRQVAVVNLDPANSPALLPYTPAIDLSDLITLEDAMQSLKLGPNGGLVYCMEFLSANRNWLTEELKKLPKSSYVLFDLPGQVELFTHNNSVQELVSYLVDKEGCRLSCVQLVDSHYCADAAKFVSVALTSLCSMLHLALPHVNVLSKADLIEMHGKLPFNLDYFTEILDLGYLAEHLNQDPFLAKYKKFNEALIGVIEDQSLVSFVLLDVQDKEALWRVIQRADRANGYGLDGKSMNEERDIQSLLSCAVQAEFQYETIRTVHERHIHPDADEEMDTN